MDRLGLGAAQLAQPLGRPAGRRGQHDIQPERLEDPQHAAHRGRFTGARAAGQHGHAVLGRRRDGRTLQGRIVDVRVHLERAEQLVHIEIIVVFPFGKQAQGLGQVGLGLAQGAQIDRVPVADKFAHQQARTLQPGNALLDPWDLIDDLVVGQQVGNRLRQLFDRDKGVSVVQIKGHGI